MAGMSIDRQKLQELLRDFRTLTGICISFWYHGDEWSVIGDTVYASPFCALLRQNETLRHDCEYCDARGLNHARETGEVCRLVCHAGLHEYTYPVQEAGRTLGYFMIGQVRLPDDGGGLSSEMVERWRALGMDVQEMQRLYHQLPVMTSEKMLSACHMLDALAKYVYIQGMIRRTEPPLCKKIMSHVRSNLARPMTLDSIAAALNVSRSTLCHTVRSEMNTSMIELIRRMRVEKVVSLLQDGWTLQAAALEAGFSSSSYCSRVFKQVLGAAPGAFAKADREGKEELGES